MNEGAAQFPESYPREIRTTDDRPVTLRLMERSDRDGMVTFARALPPDDLLFLRKDITDPEVVSEWVRDLERGRTVTVLAEAGGALLGYGALWLDETFWGRPPGAIRARVRPPHPGP